MLGLGLCVLLFLLWTQFRETTTYGRADTTGVVGAPNAYDSYLEGLGLLERWDKAGNLDAAISLFQEAKSLDPGFALAYARLADGLRIRYALSGDETWLEQANDNINEAVRLGPGLGPVQVALGRLQAMQGNFDLATAALERALSIDSNDAAANEAIASLYARLGRLEDAEASFRKALALDSNNPTMHDAYAHFLSGQGRYEEAMSEWQTVIRLAPDHYAARVNMGSVLTDIGRIPESITMYQQANQIQPTYMAYSNLGTAFSRMVRYPESVEAYRKALEIDDSDWLAWGNLAYVYSWMDGKDEDSKQCFDKAILLAETAKNQDSRDPFIYSDLSLYYAKTGNPELALQNLETAVILAPDSGEILAAAAEANEILGNRDEAIEFAHKSLKSGFERQNLQRNPELADLLQDQRMQPSP